jgi:transcriptional regulator with XRE-family HTH domain
MIYDNIRINKQKRKEKIMKYTQRIKDLREDNDLKQKEIAEILKTTQQYYGQYEIGKRPLHIEHLITLCKYYNISADYILGFTDEPKPLPKK